MFANIIGDSLETGNARFAEVEVWVSDPSDKCGLIEGMTGYYDEKIGNRIVFCEFFWNFRGVGGSVLSDTRRPTCKEVGGRVSETMTFGASILLHEIL